MNNLDVVMDELDVPYTNEERPRTLERDIILLKMVKEDALELDENSRLYKLGKELNML